jgi:amidophosphoribosyltransferase
VRNAQPICANTDGGAVSIAHNGNLVNAFAIKRELEGRGAIFTSSSDSEVILHLVARSRESALEDRLIDALSRVKGAFSVLMLTDECLVAARDPNGFRPLSLGRLGTSYVVASETCALDLIGATFERDVEPGEVVVINDDGIESLRPFRDAASRFCIFEYVYFSRPDSHVEGLSVYEARKRIGAELSRESGVDADIVVPVPDSGVASAIGYAAEAGLPFEIGIIRNHYVGRTFIEPTQQIRNLGVRLKHNANRASLTGKRVILVDDSIVRGTTSVKIVEMVRAAGATEVHMRIAAPPTAHSCFYGIDTPELGELLASRMDVPAMAEHIGVNSLAFVSMDGLYRAMGEPGRNSESPQFCDACFTGDYPTQLTDHDGDDEATQLSLLAELA